MVATLASDRIAAMAKGVARERDNRFIFFSIVFEVIFDILFVVIETQLVQLPSWKFPEPLSDGFLHGLAMA